MRRDEHGFRGDADEEVVVAALVRGEVQGGGAGAGGDAMKDHVVGVAAELRNVVSVGIRIGAFDATYLGDMLLDPFEEESLVKEADVQVSVLSHPLIGEETPDSDPVVKVDKDYVAARLLDDGRPVVVGVAVCFVPWPQSLAMCN